MTISAILGIAQSLAQDEKTGLYQTDLVDSLSCVTGALHAAAPIQSSKRGSEAGCR